MPGSPERQGPRLGTSRSPGESPFSDKAGTHEGRLRGGSHAPVVGPHAFRPAPDTGLQEQPLADVRAPLTTAPLAVASWSPPNLPGVTSHPSSVNSDGTGSSGEDRAVLPATPGQPQAPPFPRCRAAWSKVPAGRSEVQVGLQGCGCRPGEGEGPRPSGRDVGGPLSHLPSAGDPSRAAGFRPLLLPCCSLRGPERPSWVCSAWPCTPGAACLAQRRPTAPFPRVSLGLSSPAQLLRWPPLGRLHNILLAKLEM